MSGDLGSGTTGYARIWRYMHIDSRFTDMMEESRQVLLEMEKETGKKIFNYGGLLFIKNPESQGYKELAKYGEVLTSA